MVFYANGMAPKSALLRFEGMWLTPTMYRLVVPAFAELRAEGVTITGNQGYRFKGTLSDYAIGQTDRSDNEALASLTSTGDGNQYYQAGRASNGSTPSAATPGFSNHGDWLIGAIDCNTNNMAARRRVFAKYGLVDNIGSESWHFANVGTLSVALPNAVELTASITLTHTEEQDMARAIVKDNVDHSDPEFAFIALYGAGVGNGKNWQVIEPAQRDAYWTTFCAVENAQLIARNAGYLFTAVSVDANGWNVVRDAYQPKP